MKSVAGTFDPVKGADVSYIVTQSGREIRFAEEWRHRNDYDIADIAHGLSHLCRFVGQCSRFYSVAEHCVRMSKLIEPKFALEALMHDATEAYCADLPRPLKELVADYREVERSIDAGIRDRFNLRGSMPAEVHEADIRMLLTEKRFLLPLGTRPWPLEINHKPYAFQDFSQYGWDPKEAKAKFLDRFEDLTK